MDNQPFMLVLDTESTGIDVFEDRVIQFAAGVYDAKGNQLEFFETFIDPGIEIPTEASDVHGKTTEWIREHGGDPVTEFTKILELFRKYWGKVIFVAYNAAFDTTLLNEEFKRHGLTDRWGHAMASKAKMYDPFVVDRAKDKYRKGKRTLLALGKHFGLDFDEDDLHDAEADVKLTAQVAIKAIERYGFQTNVQQARMHEGWAKGFRSYKLKQDPSFDATSVSGAWPVRFKEDI